MKWNSIKEAKPKDSCVCLLVSNENYEFGYHLATYSKYSDEFIIEIDDKFVPVSITHWLEIPKLDSMEE